MSRLCLEVLPNCVGTLSCITSCLLNERKNPVLLAFVAFLLLYVVITMQHNNRLPDTRMWPLFAGHEPGAKPSPPAPLILAVRQ